MGWVNDTQHSVLDAGQGERWWWAFRQEPQAIVIQPIPVNTGGNLHMSDQSVELNLDGSTTYYITIDNEGPHSVEYYLLGVFQTQPSP